MCKIKVREGWSSIIEERILSCLTTVIVNESRESRISRIYSEDRCTRNLASDRICNLLQIFLELIAVDNFYGDASWDLWQDLDETIARAIPEVVEGHVWRNILFRTWKSFYTLVRRSRKGSNAHGRLIGDRNQVSFDKMHFLKACFKIELDRSYAETIIIKKCPLILMQIKADQTRKSCSRGKSQ